MDELKMRRFVKQYEAFYTPYYSVLSEQKNKEQVNEQNLGSVANVQSYKEELTLAWKH